MLRLLKPSRASALTELSPEERPVDPLGALARAATSGDRGASQTLLVALGPGLLRTVRGVLGPWHADVEDVLQESMLAVYAALSGFRAECPTSHFACRIAALTAMNARRRAGYRARHTPSVPPEELDGTSGPESLSPAEAHAARRRRETLRGLLDELPLVQAEALVLHTVLGYSVEETARVTHTPSNTVRSRLRAALSALRERIDGDGALLERLEPSS